MSRRISSLCRASTSLALGAVLVFPAVYASAQTTVSDSETAKLFTGTTGDLTISSTGSLTVNGGNAVIVNSNSSVANAGVITVNNAATTSTGSAGILIGGGHTGSISNTGQIANTDSKAATAVPLTAGEHRYGIEVLGSSPFIGTIDNASSGSITVLGNDSAGIVIGSGGLTGSVTNEGAISATGNNTFGILTNGALSGGVWVSNSITAVGTGAGGIQLNGAVGGQVYIKSVIVSTGFYNGGPTTARPFYFTGLTADNFLIGGPALSINGSVGRGVIVDTAGQLLSYGSAAALQIAPNSGAASISVPAGGTSGLLIAGDVEGNGIYDTTSASAVQIGSLSGGGSVTINGGIGVTGTVAATSYAANATALSVLGGATVPTLNNTGTISAVVNYGADTNATVGGNATAIVVSNGSLSTITNTGVISASTAAGSAIALDLRGDLVPVTVNQFSSGSTSAPSSITGDILFGAAGASLNLANGSLSGAVAFGASTANALTITGGAVIEGALTQAAGGNLKLSIVNGRLASTSVSPVTLTSLNLGAKSEVDFAINPATAQGGTFAVLHSVSIADGAKFGLTLDGQLTTPENFTVVQTVGSTGALLGQPQVLLGDVPYFYLASLNQNASAGTISISVRNRTFVEAGVSGSQSAYDAVFKANYNDSGIRDAFNGAGSYQSFKRLYQQMLPSYSGGLFEILQQGTSAIAATEAANPLVQSGEHGGGWAQQVGFGAVQGSRSSPGFHGGGLGFAFGWETPISTISSWGVSASYIRGAVDDFNAGPANQEIGTVYGVGAYWREDDGSFQTNASLNAGIAEMNSTRNFAGPDLNGTTVSRTASAAWNGGVAQAHVGVSYRYPMGDYYVKPLLMGDYFVLYSGKHAERNGGSGFDLNMAANTGTQGTITGGVALGTQFGDKFFMWRPELMVGYKQVFGGPDDVTAQFAGGSAFTLSPTGQKGGPTAHLGIHGGNKFSDIAVEAGGEDRGAYKGFDGKVVARFRF